MQNRAAYLPSKQAALLVHPAPYTHPLANELVVRTRAIAVNPADVGIQRRGILLTRYPAILGCDVAGDVVEVHPSLSARYSVGDRVAGAATCLRSREGDARYCYAGFQEYVVLRAPHVVKIPASIAFEDAAVLPLGVNTAASCMFSDKTLALSLPRAGAEQQQQRKTVVLVWGASSSVGACAVQLATHAGYEVLGVASRQNHALVASLGATACFDYHDAGVVDQIVRYAQGRGKDVAGALSCIASDSVLDALCETLDGIASATTAAVKKLVVSVTPGAEARASRGVAVVTNFVPGLEDNDFATPVWAWLDHVMAQGSIKYAPPCKVVGKGLEELQQAVDLLAKGVSAEKLIVLV